MTLNKYLIFQNSYFKRQTLGVPVVCESEKKNLICLIKNSFDYLVILIQL